MIDEQLSKISVLIPCHNARGFVAAALDSILAQTWRNFEIIVVDDGSADDSASVVQSYAAKGVRLIRQENRGAAAARNRAFAKSCGEFVLYLDADDLIGANHLAALAQRLQQDRLLIALSPWDRFYQMPEEATFPSRSGYVDASGAEWLAAEWAQARPMTQSGMFLIPRRLIEIVGGWNESLSLIDDFEFFARVISKSEGVRFAPDARLYYRSGIAGSLGSTKGRKAVESALHSLQLGTQCLLGLEDTAENRRSCANLFQDFDFTYYPEHPDLRSVARRRVLELGGSQLEPDGPPGFHKMRRFCGWRVARRFQHLATTLKITTATRAARSERGMNVSERAIAGTP